MICQDGTGPEIMQERVGAYHYTLTENNEVYVQDLLKPYDVPENRWEGKLIYEGACHSYEDAKAFLRARILQDLHEQTVAGLEAFK